MKTILFLTGIALIFIINGAGVTLAQSAAMQHDGKGLNFEKGKECHIPNLTEEQQSKIKEYRITYLKEMQTYRNQLGELKAKERTLTTAVKPDLKAINANIDEISKVQNQMMKSRAAHQQQVRSLLTDEQKLWFDAHRLQEDGHKKKGNDRDHRMYRKENRAQG